MRSETANHGIPKSWRRKQGGLSFFPCGLRGAFIREACNG
jgi:hypothetical protein